jgi:RNA polymerase sigma-70 factor, ECF subfamily
MMSTHTATDGELIQRAACSDHEAFDALYRRHAGPVFRIALRRLRDRGSAEDATQETFAAVWRSAGSYRAERGSGTAWLYTVARNAIVDRARRRPIEPSDPPEAVFDGPGPDAQTESAWLRDRLYRAVGGLPEEQRVVIELAYWRGLSQSEIADRLVVPLGTVKTRTRAGLARLADVLEDEQLL